MKILWKHHSCIYFKFSYFKFKDQSTKCWIYVCKALYAWKSKVCAYLHLLDTSSQVQKQISVVTLTCLYLLVLPTFNLPTSEN